MANRYFLRSRLPENKARLIIRCFADDLTETATAEETGLTRKTVNGYFQKIRLVIYNHDRRRLGIPIKRLPIDKRYLLSNLQSRLNDNELKNTFRVISIMLLDGRLIVDVIYTDSNELIAQIFLRLKKSYENKEIFNFDIVNSKFMWTYGSGIRTSKITHENLKNIDEFCTISSKRLKSFYGIKPSKFLLHLKECQWRFNNLTHKQMTDTKKPNDLYRKLLKLLRDNPA